MAADNVFSLDPYSSFLDQKEADLAAPTAPKADSALSAFEGIASRTNVPVNLLIAYADQQKAADIGQAVSIAETVAKRYGTRLQEGAKIEDLVAEDLGDAATAEQLIGKARDIGRQLYPERYAQMEASAQEEPGIWSRLGKAFRQGDAQSIAATNEFSRDLEAAVEESALGRAMLAIQKRVGVAPEDMTVQQRAQELRNRPKSAFHASAEKELEKLEAEGFQVKHWSDVRGLASGVQFVAENLATSLPHMGAAMASGALAPVTQTLMLGAEANEELKERTDLTEGQRVTVATGAGVLMWGFETLGMGSIFKDILPSQVASSALADQLTTLLVSKGITPSAARIIQAGVVEGSTELIQEGIVMGATSASGGKYEAGEVADRLTQAFLAGGGVGASLRGVGEPFYRAPEGAEAAPEPQGGEDPATAPQEPPVAPEAPQSAATPPSRPRGPLESALESASPSLYPEFSAGDAVDVVSADGETYAAEYLVQGADHIAVMINGEKIEIPLDEFQAGGFIAPRSNEPASQLAGRQAETPEDDTFDLLDDGDVPPAPPHDPLGVDAGLDPSTLLPIDGQLDSQPASQPDGLQADTTETATVPAHVSSQGPWDFNQSFPSPDPAKLEARRNGGRENFELTSPDDVVGTLQETLSEAVDHRLVALEWADIARELMEGSTPPKNAGFKRGMTGDEMVALADRNADEAMNSLREIEGTLRDYWPDEAVDQMAGWVAEMADLTAKSQPVKDKGEPASQPDSLQASQPESGKAEKGEAKAPGAVGYSFKLADRFPIKDQKTLAKHRFDDVGELVGRLDAAARRAEAQLRTEGLDSRDFDLYGNDKGGKSNQWAIAIGQAEALASELLHEARKNKTGELDWPKIDDSTGEMAAGQETTVAAAVEWLDNLEALNPPINETYAGNANPQGDGDTTPMDRSEIFPEPQKTENIDLKLKRKGFVEADTAEARLEFWKDTAKDIGKNNDNSGKVVISLFDYTGQWAQPWRDAGYRVLQHDIKTDSDILADQWIRDQIEEARAEGFEIVGVLSACPCKTFSGAGARWWEGLHDVETPEAVRKVFGDRALAAGAKSPLHYNQMLVDATFDVIELAAPTRFHALENPIGRIKDKSDLPEPTFRFHPHNFGDPYTKRTQIWGDVRTDLPTANVDPVEGSKMQSKLRGDDPLQKEQRSTTPLGFAYAFFMAHDPDARKVLAKAEKIEKPARQLAIQKASQQEGRPASKTVKPKVKEITQAEWDRKPDDYKTLHPDGRRTWAELDPETGATISRPVAIKPASLSDGQPASQQDGLPTDAELDAAWDAAMDEARTGEDVAAEIDAAAKEADPNPTEGQREAGNYKMGHTRWNGLDLTFENARGSERNGVDPDGKPWSVTMPANYGYIKQTEGADGDHVDIYMGEAPDSNLVVIVNQVDADTRKFDEHKVILGTHSLDEALKLYRAGFSDGKGQERIGSYSATDVDSFKGWLKDQDTTRPASQPDSLQAGKQDGEPAHRSAGEAAKSAVSNTAKGFTDLAEGLGALFGAGDATKLSSGLTFDKETYEKAKPYFIEGVKRLGMAGADIKDMMVALIRELRTAGMTFDQIQNMKPYAKQFVTDVVAGDIDLEANTSKVENTPQETTDDLGSDPADSQKPLADSPPQGGGELATSGAGGPEPRSGRAGADGDQGSGTDRGGRSDGVGGRAKRSRSDSTSQDRSLSPNPAARRDGEVLGDREGENPGNFSIDQDFALGEGTDGQKIKANLAAIRLLRQLDEDHRFATPEEQKVLAAYVGWGGLKSVFDVKKTGASDQFGKAQAELRELLSEDEYNAASASVRNAHYTARPVVDVMWQIMGQFGFTGGRALEPTVGTGNFLGLQPSHMAAGTEWHAAEMDTITGLIAKHLYPEASVMAGTPFQEAQFADGVFDIAIGNPPFGSNVARDPRRPALDGMKIHNYVIAKSGEHLRPGGIMAMVVTHRFLDTADAEGRAELAKRFKFVGAVRLPNDAFAKNAGTDVVTDIVFLQKLKEGEKPDLKAAWLDTKGEIEGGIRVNRYYQENPGNIMGRSAMDGTMYGGRGNEYTVHSRPGVDIFSTIKDIAAKDWADVTLGNRSEQLDAVSVTLNQSEIPIGGFALRDGKIQRRGMDDAAGNAVIEDVTAETLWADDAEHWGAQLGLAEQIRDAAKRGEAPTSEIEELNNTLPANLYRKAKPTKAEQALLTISKATGDAGSFAWAFDTELSEIRAAVDRKRLGEKNLARLTGLLDLRNQTLNLIHAEKNDMAGLEDTRKKLDEAYDTFVKSHGYIGDPQNRNVLKGDVGVELGLEAVYTGAEPAQKADPKRGLPVAPRRKSMAIKAAILSRRVNFPYKEIASAKDVQEGLAISLSERGRLDLPYIAKLLGKTTDQVIEELQAGDAPSIFFDPDSETYVHAEEYLSGNVRYKLVQARDAGVEANITALEKAQPDPLTRERIVPSIRSQWVPEEVFQEFLADLGLVKPRVSIIPSAGFMRAGADRQAESDFGLQFKDADATILELFNAAATGKPLKITRPIGDGKRVEDKPASERVNALVDRLTKTFAEWAYSDADRADRIVDAFNEKMNTHVKRVFDGERFLKTVGSNPAIKLRLTQKNAAWRMIQERNVLLDHVVGAGKTFTAITGVMERKRLGISRKPMVVVPNHLVVQWARDFYMLYPGARILAATPKDFEAKNRRRLFARIATGDYDAIIIGHSSLSYIETPKDDQKAIIDEQIADIKFTLDEMRRKGESGRTLSQIENRIESYKEKLKELAAKKSDALGFDFADMGVDYLVVDEAHEFKNLEYATGGERVVGMNDPKGSKKAFDLYTKIRGLQSRGGGVTFATGTPVSNSLVEIYTVMKYLAYDELKKRDQANFDAWSSAYAETETRMEYTATQKLKPRRVLSGLSNLASMGQLYEQFGDIITMDTLKELYSSEVAARNKETGGNERTEFPVPKVKSGGRLLDSAPLTEAQSEYMDYLVSRMQTIERMAHDKDYAKKDNPLWVLSDARKMSLDIRAVDPLAERDESGKVMRAANRIKDKYDFWAEDRGTQMVFSDLSTPSKQAVSDARKIIRDSLKKILGDKPGIAEAMAIAEMSYQDQWRHVQVKLDAALEIADGDKVDAIEEHMASLRDVEAAMTVADVGFSVYDDLRTVLIEKGIPGPEIAFIHDYNTPEQKQRLFAAVNDGRIRVLIGSSAKMGAGTNAQKRLVALHHMDAPWRPSDVEQREGRIIRQGNMFYERDPEGFEVEIYAYSTNGTSDTVMWQILERKSGAIEKFRSASLDAVEEDGADSDQYAEFMASSTGNPVFRLKLETERRLSELVSETSGALLARSTAKRFLKDYEERVGELKARIAGLKAVSLGSIAYKRKTGDAKDLKAAMDHARSAYDKRYAAWAEKQQVSDARASELQAQGLALAEINEILAEEGLIVGAKPSVPTMASEAVVKKSSYAKLVRQVLTDARDIGDGGTLSFKMGEAKLRLSRRNMDFGGSNVSSRFTLSLDAGGVWLPIAFADGRNPVGSIRLQRALVPTNLQEFVKDELEHRQDQLQKLNEQLPRQKELAAREVDTSERDATRDALEWYKIEVALAENDADAKRAERNNRYIADETERPLSNFAALRATPTEYEFDGETYETTGVVARDHSQAYARFNEATRKSDGARVILLTEKQKEADEYHPHGVIEEPQTVKQFRGFKAIRRKQRKKTSAELERLSDKLHQNMREMGLDGRLKLDLSEVIDIEGLDSDFEVDGFYFRKAIHVALNAPDAEFVLDHEAIHALRDPRAWGQPYGLFTQAEWRRLVAYARSDKKMMAAAARDYADHSLEAQIEEVIANQYAAWRRNARPVPNPVLRLFRRIRNVFAALRRALLSEGVARPEDLFARIQSGAISARASDPTFKGVPDPRQPLLASGGGLSGPIRLSRREKAALVDKIIDAAQSAAEGIQNARKRVSKEGASNALTDAMNAGKGRYSILGLVPGRALFAELGKVLPSARTYLRTKESMDALRNEWHARTDDVAQAWRKLIKADPKANERLMELMHRSTIAQIDPAGAFKGFAEKWHIDTAANTHADADMRAYAQSKLDEDGKRRALHSELRAAYKALPKEFQDMYRRVRDEYAQLATAHEKAVLEHLAKAADAGLKRAQERHDLRIEEIEQAGLSKQDEHLEKEQAHAALKQAIKRNGWTRQAKIAGLRAKFEANRLKGPYFPLARFGEYFVTLRDQEGNMVSFSMFETQREQKAEIKRAEGEGYKVSHGVMSNKKDLKGAVDQGFVSDVEDILGEADVSDTVMDAVWQRWLESLPDASIRTNRIHRKARAGYTHDAFRAFGKQVFHGSHQLARLKYSVDLEEALRAMRKEAPKAKDPNRAGLLVNEMAHRHEFIMNPTGASWATAATSAAFIWYLGATPAAAMVNVTQTSVVGTPLLGAAFQKQGMKGAAEELTRAMLDFARGKGHVLESKRLTAGEKRALNEAYARGTVDKTQAHDLAGVAETGVAYSDFRTRWMRRISWFFHHAERMNREVTFLAAYRMARKEKIGQQEAIERAADLTWKIHFDYQNTSRPRAMQGDVAKVLLTFKNFTVNMLYRLLRDSHQALQGATPRERAEARSQLIGITASMAFHAGITGVWGFKLVMGLVGLAFDGGDEEAEERLKALLVGDGENAMRRYMAGMVLNGVPGHITGISLSERIGMPSLWFRDSGRDLEGRDWYLHMMEELLGPVPGIAESLVRGAHDMTNGDFIRGFETASPKVVRDAMRAGRYLTEGVTTRKGDPIIEDVSIQQALVQALGFTPAQVAERYKMNSRMYNMQRGIQDERKDLVKDLRNTLMKGRQIPAHLKQDVIDFNQKYPTYQITTSTIRRSISSRQTAKQRNEFGVQLSPKLNQQIRRSIAKPVYE